MRDAADVGGNDLFRSGGVQIVQLLVTQGGTELGLQNRVRAG